MALRFGHGRRGPGTRALGPFANAAWTPARLFAASEKGAWYDPSDLSTLFQDAAGTTPVTAAGQPVGKVTDKSGNGNHLTSAGTARPTLEVDANGFYYLKGDGIDGRLDTAAVITVTAGTKKATVFVGQKPDAVHNGMLMEYSGNAGVFTGSFSKFYISGTDEVGLTADNNAYGDLAGVGTTAAVNTTMFDITQGATVAGAIRYRVNGVLQTFTAVSGNTPGTTASFGSWRFYMLGRDSGSFPFNGRVYGLVVRFAESTAAEIGFAETWINARMGAF